MGIMLDWMADDDARSAALQDFVRQGALLVSATLPLRANLSAVENIAVVLRARSQCDEAQTAARALELLQLLGHVACAWLRDADLTCEQRCAVKIARALVGRPAQVVVDRPAMLLPNTDYPIWLLTRLTRASDCFAQCHVVDYLWNKPIYPAELIIRYSLT